MPKKEFKVGETFQCGLVKLRVVKEERAGTCTGCDLHGLECCIAIQEFIGSCFRADREDKNDVIFVKVEE